ncbi:GGDEF domain-containing protein [Actinoplanes sp. N902-109]|uniref:GGDEF domain-containing protein n=1 Tax=Actinoplanes sp. (strain N902-109) TaxID=649831 RepID=UPI0003295AAE|nr:GGDEF domain-containing protein [Actinoplanes sp. N902-109]AGL12189.1 putative signaling protein [Actinoplanes sp. N902-109]AGL16459.1 putative signaling protein [Actinoplanes sp. N902-109]
MRKSAGVPLLLAGAVITALTPDSIWGQAAYLACFAGVVVAAWAAVRRPGPRRPWALVAGAVTSWLAGDLTAAVLQLTGRSPTVGLQDVFWLGGYPLMGAAILGMVRLRAPRQSRAALQDGLTLTTAAGLAAWQFFIEPELHGGGTTMTIAVGALYPIGDLVLFAAVVYLALSPGRNGAPSMLLIAGNALSLVLDTVLTTFSDALTGVNGDRFNAALLLANALVVASGLHRDRDQLLQPAPVDKPRIHPARLMFLGLAMLTGPILAVGRETGPIGGRLLMLAATATTAGLCLARFTTAVHEQGRVQDRLAYLADHDNLTGLVNRRVLNERLARAFQARTGLALLYLDLDGFKAVNDEHGHAAGDAVLVEVGRRIRAGIGAGDLAARLGGDEFAVLCEQLDPAGAAALAERLRRAVSEPIPADGAVLHVGASIGVAAGAGCTDGDELMFQADRAMFEMKRGRRAMPGPASHPDLTITRETAGAPEGIRPSARPGRW